MRKSPDFILNERKLEIVYSYKYLGVLFNYNGKFTVAKNELHCKGSLARFCKHILSLNKSTCSNMVYGELGTTPMLLHAQSITHLCYSMLKVEQIKLSNAIYQLLLKLCNDGIFESQWETSVKSTLESCGFPGVWRNQTIFKKQLQQRLADQFLQKWSAEIYDSKKCINYRIFKKSLILESYLIDLSNDKISL